jgi:hypothetical protein
MARSRSDGRRLPAVRPQRAIVIAVLVMLLPLGLLGASLVPIAVDYGTGVLFRLRPVEIVAVFD